MAPVASLPLNDRGIPSVQLGEFGTPPSLTSEVFEVETRTSLGGNPATQRHIIDVHKAIPDPWDDEWNDPFNQPAFAQRTQDSLLPTQP